MSKNILKNQEVTVGSLIYRDVKEGDSFFYHISGIQPLSETEVLVKLEIMYYYNGSYTTREYIVTKGESLSIKRLERKPSLNQIGEGIEKNTLFEMIVSDFSNNKLTLTLNQK